MFFLVMLEPQVFDLRVLRAPLGTGPCMGASLAVPSSRARIVYNYRLYHIDYINFKTLLPMGGSHDPVPPL